MIRLADLKIVFPGHVSVDMALRGTVDRCSMSFERGF